AKPKPPRSAPARRSNGKRRAPRFGICAIRRCARYAVTWLVLGITKSLLNKVPNDGRSGFDAVADAAGFGRESAGHIRRVRGRERSRLEKPRAVGLARRDQTGAAEAHAGIAAECADVG